MKNRAGKKDKEDYDLSDFNLDSPGKGDRQIILH